MGGYGGVGVKAWGRLLGSDSTAIRLFALRALAALGEAGARVLLECSGLRPQERYAWMWALMRCVDREQLSRLGLSTSPSASPLAWARFLVRREARAHVFQVRPGRAQCVEALLVSMHPLQTLACAVRLLDLHGERAIPALLEVVRLRPPPGRPEPRTGVTCRMLGVPELLEEKAACAAWALGRLGRIAVPEIVQEYAGASRRVRAHLAMALWYMGAQAARAIPVLLLDPGPLAGAALLAMEGAASLAMVEARRGPVWLDDDSVRALARLAFSDEGREYAAASLACFGPSAHKGVPILRHLCADPEVEVRRMVARALGWGGRPETLNLVLPLLKDEDEVARRLALRALESFFDSPGQTRMALLDWIMVGSAEEGLAAAAQLAELGLPEERCQEVGRLLESGSEQLVLYLVEALAASSEEQVRPHQVILLKFLGLEHRPALRRSAARALAKLATVEPQVLDAVRCWLREGDPELVHLAAEILSQAGAGLGSLGPDWASLAEASLLAVLESWRYSLRVAELLALLQHPAPAVRARAADMLGQQRLGSPEVLAALTAQVREPDKQLRLACARALYAMGEHEFTWMLLDSPRRSDQIEANLVLLREATLPEAFLEAFEQGEICNAKVLHLLKESLPPARRAELLAHAFPHHRGEDRKEVGLALLRLGVAGLDRLPELLGQPHLEVRGQVLDLLSQFLEHPQQSYSDWLARRGMVLPLEHPDPDMQQRLHVALASYIVRSRAWADERLEALLGYLSRSPHVLAAARAVDCLGRALAERGALQLRELLLEALEDHPDSAVRWEALRALRFGAADAELGRRLSRLRPEPHIELRLERLALESGLIGLEGARLAQALVLGTLHGRVGVFSTAENFPHVVALLRDPSLRGIALSSIEGYPGPLTAMGWKALLRACLERGEPALLVRFPRLVVGLLKWGEQGLERVVQAGPGSAGGLRMAQEHRSARVRLLAVRAREELGV